MFRLMKYLYIHIYTYICTHTYINIHKYNRFIKKRNVYIKFDMSHLYTTITQDSLLHMYTVTPTHKHTYIPTHTITHTASNAAQ